MGTVAQAALDGGGHVTGIIPDFLKSRERMLDEIQETIVVEDMHTRKRLMFERSDAFVALPGGIGTIAELVDILTWKQLGRHAKPIIILDIDGYWTPLAELLDHIVARGFSHGDLKGMYRVVPSVDGLADALGLGSTS